MRHLSLCALALATALAAAACSKQESASASASAAAAAAPVAGASGAAPSGAAAVSFDKPEKAIGYRQSAFTLMGAHFGTIGAMVNGKAPFDAKAAADSAEVVAYMAKLPWTAFGPGTDKGADTKAKPEIWSNHAEFQKDADKLQAETPKLVAAARSGDLNQLKTAFQATAQTCKGCHDTFRAK